MARMDKTRLLAALWRDRGGAAAAEFAIALPLLLAMGLGAVEAGRLLYQHHVLTKAVNDAAHYAARLQDCTWALSGGALNATTVNLVKSGNPAGGAPYLLPQWADAGSTVTVTTANFDNSAGIYRGGASMPVIVVRAAVPASSAILSALGLGGSLVFRVSHEERCIGS